MTATKAQLREEIRQLRSVGAQMSNVCFTAKDFYRPDLSAAATVEINNSYLGMLDELRVLWDAIERVEGK